ncbi:lecithin retinol acyltransferase family protein [Dialister sp.]|uniref:lecithin retinol acyltransferase family protein n=1 Tax=Dialister sp. TaxID=1955814 RepID=UPI002E7FED5A|nr:lecithin retinol acyltransferase family protein [Dialister sp.]MEE3453038.1 lecithin retinol acyltransferase family protein [Dialister sp.]
MNEEFFEDLFHYLTDEPGAAKAGDVIYVQRTFYKHYGVYIGNKKVIHFAPKKEGGIAVIHETTLSKFLGDEADYHVVDFSGEKVYTRETTVRRAKRCLGIKGYDLISSNCEHFALWCRTGHKYSTQVEDPEKALPPELKLLLDLGK